MKTRTFKQNLHLIKMYTGRQKALLHSSKVGKEEELDGVEKRLLALRTIVQEQCNHVYIGPLTKCEVCKKPSFDFNVHRVIHNSMYNSYATHKGYEYSNSNTWNKPFYTGV